VFIVKTQIRKKDFKMCHNKCHILHRNCLLQWVIEGKIKGWIEVTGRQGRRCIKLLDDLKERRGYSHLKEEALDRTIRRACFGRGFGPVVRQTT
jgi:metal-responsive CopG/Arc/MetJ family transcriptional regulator